MNILTELKLLLLSILLSACGMSEKEAMRDYANENVDSQGLQVEHSCIQQVKPGTPTTTLSPEMFDSDEIFVPPPLEYVYPCNIDVTASLSKEESDGDAFNKVWGLAFTSAPGDIAPACDSSSAGTEYYGDSIIGLPGEFKGGETYSFRACAWNRQKSSYSSGVVQTIQLPLTD